SRNLPIVALVKSTYLRCNAIILQQKRERSHNNACINQVYMQVLNKETVNLREVQFVGDFMVRLDEWWCNCGKFQKLHMPCSHVVATCKHTRHGSRNYICPVHMLESVSNMYRELLAELHNEAY
ncbi:hypothetical protein glysoja_047324, partial [Glycine soja]